MVKPKIAKKEYILPEGNDLEVVAETLATLGSQKIDMSNTQLKKRTSPVGAFDVNLGKQISDQRNHLIANPDNYQVPVMELTREMMKDWPQYLEKAINEGIEKLKGDFFVVILLKNEKLFPEVFRATFVTRDTCPTPNYDQTVYKYFRETEQLHYLWTVPDRDLCFEFLENAHKIEAADKDLLKMIHMFGTGQLKAMAMKLNGELEEDYTKQSLEIIDA